jgi:hypothetical protein
VDQWKQRPKTQQADMHMELSSGKELSRNRVSANTLLAPQAKNFSTAKQPQGPFVERAVSRSPLYPHVVVVQLRGSIYYLKSGVYNVRLSIYIIGYMPAANRCGCRWPAS